MAEQHEDRENVAAETSTPMLVALLKEMKAINTNITTMHNDINNLVVVNDTDDVNRDVDDHEADGEAEALGEATETASVVSLDARVDHLLMSTKTSHEESATTSRTSLLSSIAQDLAANEKTGTAVQKDLANIVASLVKNKLPDDKVQTKLAKYPRPENIGNLQTPRVNPLIWTHISATARSTDVKYQKIQQSLMGAMSAMTYAAEQAIESNCCWVCGSRHLCKYRFINVDNTYSWEL